MKPGTLILVAALLPGVAFANHDTKEGEAATRDTARPVANPANPMPSAAAKTDQAKGEETMTDARLAARLHKVNKMEIDAGQLAEKQGESAAMKNFGKQLKADHTAADHKLMGIARKANLDLDSSLTARDQEMFQTDERKMDEVKKMHGAEFDRGFASFMEQGHKDVIDMLDKHEGDVRDQDLKKFVDDTRPVLKHHEEVASKLMKGKEPKAQGRAPQLEKR